jgi:type 1 glutamine amidotransferase
VSKLRVLLLIGGHASHNQPVHYAELASLLAGEGGADLRMTDDLDALNPSTLAEYPVIANYTSWMEPSTEQVGALVDAIEGGHGYLGLHAATATFWNSAAYLRMVGAKFARHDPFKRFRVHIEDRRHPITNGVDDFDVEDELYELEADFSTAEVLASAEHHTLLYVKRFGRGRVHYNALGHDARALAHPSYRRLVLQGLGWVSDHTTA